MDLSTKQQTQLTPAEFERVKQFAKLNGITVEQAATQLAKVALDARYRLRRLGLAKVFPLRRD